MPASHFSSLRGLHSPMILRVPYSCTSLAYLILAGLEEALELIH